MPKTLLKAEILKNAVILSSQYGFDNIQMRELAFEVGVSEEELKGFFADKQQLRQAIFAYIPSVLQHYCPTVEDIDELLAHSTPNQILNRFVTAYDLHSNTFYRQIYRFVFMEQYRDKESWGFCCHYITNPPMENAKHAVDLLAARKLIPPCDSGAITEMWNRTSLVYEMLTTHINTKAEKDAYLQEYLATTQFFIELIVRGVKQIPVEALEATWKKPPYWEDIKPDSHDVKRTLMRNALDLFSERGYTQVTMLQIARAAGVDLSVAYRHYHAKSSIMQEIVDAVLHTAKAYEEEPVFQSEWDRGNQERVILTLADAYSLSKDATTLKLYRILFREQYYNEDVRDYLVSSILTDVEKITRQLNKMIQEKRIKPCDTRNVAIAFVYSMCSLTIEAAVNPDVMERTDQVRVRLIAQLVSFLINGYMT